MKIWGREYEKRLGTASLSCRQLCKRPCAALQIRSETTSTFPRRSSTLRCHVRSKPNGLSCRQSRSLIIMKQIISRRSFVQSSARIAAACASQGAVPSFAQPSAASGKPSSGMGLASYTFRNFSRAQLIGFMKQLNVSELNAKDVKDHLPMDPAGRSESARGLCRGGH